MGVWQPGEDGQGKWKVQALSEDQTGKSISEVQRYVYYGLCQAERR